MTWSLLALTPRLRRNLTIAALIASAVALSLTIYLLGYTDSDGCDPPLPELRDAWELDRPGCRDGGTP
jgi:hypothetical protein